MEGWGQHGWLRISVRARIDEDAAFLAEKLAYLCEERAPGHGARGVVEGLCPWLPGPHRRARHGPCRRALTDAAAAAIIGRWARCAAGKPNVPPLIN